MLVKQFLKRSDWIVIVILRKLREFFTSTVEIINYYKSYVTEKYCERHTQRTKADVSIIICNINEPKWGIGVNQCLEGMCRYSKNF